ncbi:MAG TPA: ATP-dependent DNA ligase [Microlunatus sp.]|nr:ATP-dependent DNA ligase [Microlunatus sp.]
MLLERLADTSRDLAATRSRNAKRDLLAAVLADAGPDDVAIVVSYLGGSLRQRRTGVGWRSLQDLPAPAETASLDVLTVDTAFEEMATLAGPGSTTARTAALHELFGRATATEQRFLIGLVSGELRQGALDALVQEGLARAYEVPVAAVRRAAMLLSSTTAAAQILLAGGLAALEEVGLSVGTGIQPMLAASAPTPQEALERTGVPALVDHKIDGIRIQVHRDGDRVQVFTRSLDEITDRLPEVIDAVRALPATRLVLDGEVLAVRPDGRPEKFQVIASRTASSADVPAVSGRTPLRPYFFDLLHLDGRDLLTVPLADRMAVMVEQLPAELIVPRRVVADADQAEEVFADAVHAGYEGVVIKTLSSEYAAGRRDPAWVKVKPRHTFDLVVTAVEWGHGRREGWLSNLHLAAPDERTGELIMLGKTFKGMTDEMLDWQTERFLALEERRTRHVVYVRPTTVVEIACDGLQTSVRYPGGVALRFARVLRYRPDKSADQADTLQTVKALAVG